MDQGRIRRHKLNKCYPFLKEKWKVIISVINFFLLNSRLCSKSNWREPSALNLRVNHRVPSIESLWKIYNFLVRKEHTSKGHWALLQYCPCKLQQLERPGQISSLGASTSKHVTGNKRECTYHLDVFMQPIKNLSFPEANHKTVPAYILYPQGHGVLRSLKNVVTSCHKDARRNWEKLKNWKQRERNDQ